jgi:hypothetical protein
MPTALLGSQRKEDRWNFFTSSVKKEVNPSLGILRAWAAVPPAHPTMYFRMARAAPPTSPCWPLKNRSFSPWANVASLKGEPPRKGLRGGSPSEGGGLRHRNPSNIISPRLYGFSRVFQKLSSRKQ